MNVLLAGQKYFGRAVLEMMLGLPGIAVVAASAPIAGEDKLAIYASQKGVPLIPAGTLRARNVPHGTDLIVAAHSHDFISEKTRHRANYGAIGYHPSLLPIHRGRDAIRWAIHNRERITGGTVYWLTNGVDCGPVLAQRHVFIRPDDDPTTLWRRELLPLGLELLSGVLLEFAEKGPRPGVRQSQRLATWEPAFGVPPLHRPDLLMLPAPAGGA